MDLRQKQVTKRLDEYEEIKTLIKRAFPAYEQNPMWLLNHWAKKEGTEFTAYYDGENFCGFSFTVSLNQTVFVMYLAVSDKIRSKGYGSEILAQLKRREPDSEITLNVEPPFENAENYAQRIKRISFYERNGFLNTGKMLRMQKNDFLIMSTKKDFDAVAYSQILKKLSFGLYKAKFKTV